MSKENKEYRESMEIAGRHYHPSDYDKQDTVSSGLAETHEQVSDVYMEGTIGGTIDGEGKKLQK